MTLNDCTITENRGTDFRVLFNSGHARFDNVTIGRNSGGILINTVGGETDIEDSFLLWNDAEVLLRPIDGSKLTIHESVIAHNSVLVR